MRKGCRRGCKIAILHQFFTLKPHFVRKGCCGVESQFYVSFWHSNHFVRKGGRRRGCKIAICFSFCLKRDKKKKERDRHGGQERERERERASEEREREDVKMRRCDKHVKDIWTMKMYSKPPPFTLRSNALGKNLNMKKFIQQQWTNCKSKWWIQPKFINIKYIFLV